MKLLYGTGNPAKLASMKSRLAGLEIELIGLNDLKAEGKVIPEVPEDGNTPLENARQKAMAYYEAFRLPVFSCDSGLYFDNVPEEIQPGVHVRNVNGKYLSDDEMIEHYTGLAKQYGNLTARYRNAICFVVDEDHIYEAMEPSMASEAFILTDVPHSTVRKKGFPLDSISIDIKTNQYYYDLPADKLEQVAVEDGFLVFFKEVLKRGDKQQEVKFYGAVDDSLLKYAVVISKSNGKWVLCRHRERDTYEAPGGHREPGEDILETAKRELWEETGAVKYDIKPICVYSVTTKNEVTETGEETFGLLCYAEIEEFSGKLEHEIAEVVLMDELPDNWTYPLIQPKLIERFQSFTI